MKKLMLSLLVSLFSLAMFAQTYDVTISGVVTDEITGEFIAQQEIVIYADSTSGGIFRYYNVVYTNDYGYFMDVMQVPNGEEGIVNVSTLSCNEVLSQSELFSPSAFQFVFNFQVCSDPGQGDCEAMYYYYPDADPLSIQFIDVSIGDPTFWVWDFGDGGVSNEQNPLHIYTDSGVYTTSLTISSQDSTCFSVIEMMIRVGNDTILPGDCEAMYYYYPDADPLSIQFIDVSIGDPTFWVWDFGDGGVSNEQNPLHIYTDSGVYTTSLTISSQDSTCFSVIEMMIRVGNDTILPGDCEAFYYYYQGNEPNTVNFFDESTGDPSSWEWEFGDGITSSEQNPIHTYSTPGEYIVSLSIIADSGNCTSYFEDLVYVYNDTIWPEDCESMFFSYPDQNNLLTIIFSDMSIVGGDPSGIPDTWYWDFGDGNSSTEQNPIHTYSEEGDYDVCLTITSQIGDIYCESTECQIIRVGSWFNECEAAFWHYPEGDSINPNGGLGGLNIQFVDVSFGDIDTWEWEFDDGTSSNEQNPLHIFPSNGVYNVCLSIYNSTDSCESTYCEEIYVINDTVNYCLTWFEHQANDLTLDFQAFIEGDYNAEYTWDFGDGSTGTGATISHTYSESGIYEVLLTAVRNDSTSSCTATYFDVLWVGENISFDIYGYVYLEDSMMADYADIYLLTFDTLGNGLINVATTEVDSYGYYEFEEVSIENCVYFIQADLTDQSAYYGDYIPTYHLDAANWEEAMPILPFQFGWVYNVYMIGTTSSNTGSGFITGTVTEEGSRERLNNTEVLLLDQEGNHVKYTRTNNDGVFNFSDLAMGTYIVHTEIVGIETIPFDVTLDEQNSNSTVSVIVQNGQALLSINDIVSAYIESVEDIFPNPVSHDASLNITIKETANIEIEILNQYGQSLYKTKVSLSTGKHKVGIPSTSFAQGMYFVKITANDKISLVRKFIKLR